MSDAQQLVDDLQAVRASLVKHGWAIGTLVSWKRSLTRWIDKVTGNDNGGMCMTGAAGYSRFGDKFLQFVLDEDTGSASHYEWDDRSLAVLRALVVEAYETRKDEDEVQMYLGDRSLDDLHKADELIPLIITVNDNWVNDMNGALEWVDGAIKTAQKQLPPPEAPGVGLKRKVIRVTAEPTKVQERVEA